MVLKEIHLLANIKFKQLIILQQMDMRLNIKENLQILLAI